MSYRDLLLTPELCTDEMAEKAARTAAHLNGPEGLRDLLECLGLIQPASPVSSPLRDNLGRLRTAEAAKTAGSDAEPYPPVLAEGEKLCGCSGRKHILHPFESETTGIRAGTGARYCKVGKRDYQNRRNEAKRRAA